MSIELTNLDFVEKANPHSWFLVADNLYEQVKQLRKSHGESVNIYRDSENHHMADATNRSIFLIGGFALENALKAFLVYENPDWISNGSLSKKIRTHSLTKLVMMSNLSPYKNRSIPILKGFEEGLDSWARYPCSLTKEAYQDEQVLTERLWKSYDWLLPAYGKKLKRLLSNEWVGPHGYRARYVLEGAFLGAD